MTASVVSVCYNISETQTGIRYARVTKDPCKTEWDTNFYFPMLSDACLHAWYIQLATREYLISFKFQSDKKILTS